MNDSSTQPTAQRRLTSIPGAAEFLGVSMRTMRSYISKGFFPVYKAKGIRGGFVDVDEAREALARIKAEDYSKVRPNYGTYAVAGQDNAQVRHIVMGEAKAVRDA